MLAWRPAEVFDGQQTVSIPTGRYVCDKGFGNADIYEWNPFIDINDGNTFGFLITVQDFDPDWMEGVYTVYGNYVLMTVHQINDMPPESQTEFAFIYDGTNLIVNFTMSFYMGLKTFVFGDMFVRE